MKRGKPKGYNQYTEIKYEDLADWVGRKTKVPVSTKWLQSLMGDEFPSSEKIVLDNKADSSNNDTTESNIEYKLTQF